MVGEHKPEDGIVRESPSGVQSGGYKSQWPSLDAKKINTLAETRGKTNINIPGIYRSGLLISSLGGSHSP